MRPFALLLICLGLAAQLAGQPGGTARFAPPMPMPGDRARDSYAIYSPLLKSGPVEWRNASRKQWLIEDTTKLRVQIRGTQPKTRELKAMVIQVGREMI